MIVVMMMIVVVMVTTTTMSELNNPYHVLPQVTEQQSLTDETMAVRHS